MRCYYLTLVLLSAAAVPLVADEQPCTNGSFEQLDPQGFPADWGPVGTAVGVSDDAHQGQRSLHLRRIRGTESAETGLNRGWRPGRGTALIDRLSGGIDFYYKAISADGAKLMIYAIPMTAQNVERTESRRAEFAVPEDHLGDGQWHNARLKYDFRDDPQVKGVHFAARIVGTAGELLLDDFSYVERTGPILRFGKPLIEEDPTAPGRHATLRVPLWSDGDEPAAQVEIDALLPTALQTSDLPAKLGSLPVGARHILRFNLEGQRQGDSDILLRARGGAMVAEARVALQPRLELVNFGPLQPINVVGQRATVVCVLKNSGNATLPQTDVTFACPDGPVRRRADPLPPGSTTTVAADFTPTEQTLEQVVAVQVQVPGSAPLQRQSKLVVTSDVPLPAPAGSLHTAVTANDAVIENSRLRCVFPRSSFGWGPAVLLACKEGHWVPVAHLPQLSRLVTLAKDDQRSAQTVVTLESPQAEMSIDEARLTFHWSTRDSDGAEWRIDVHFSLAADADTLLTSHQLSCSQPGRLLAFDGPVVHALEREEAIFPGLEWLVDDEVSSSTLDIAAGHPDQVRYVVHPNMVTIPAIGVHAKWGTIGLLWDLHQKWDGEHDRPSVLFASPDRFDHYQTHVAGLFLPGVPAWVPPDQREAEMPYVMAIDRPLRLDARMLIDVHAVDALAATDAWIDWQGFPEPEPLPHGSYEGEIAFSMQGYLDSLWIPDARQWWTSKGGGMLSTKGLPPSYVADLLVGALLAPDEADKLACDRQAREICAVTGQPPRIDVQRFGGRFDISLANPSAIAGLLSSRNQDGMWAFDADQLGSGVFQGVDYRDLGPHQAVESGTTAQRAFQVLRYARISGDRRAYELMLPTLKGLQAFRVPRAAQVWEVPVHTPDVLAASNAMDAFLEAYRFSGDPQWLTEAVRWARRGLPFIYLWADPQQPYLAGGSIAVFGATWYQGSWFGRPVQWNGLCYANSLLRLAEYDQSRDWRRLAESIIRSAIHQQDLQGANVALWPDNISVIDGEKCPWVFAPRQILRNILKLTGRDEDPATVILGQGDRRLHVTSTAALSQADWDGETLRFTATFPSGEEGCVFISNVTRPDRVSVSGKTAAEGDRVELSEQPCWRYDVARAFLTLRITPGTGEAVVVQGAAFRDVTRLPETIRQIAFTFGDSAQGWIEEHHVRNLTGDSGVLSGTIIGPDPYIVCTMLDVPADQVRSLALRIRLTAGQGGQLFWTTDTSPGFDEAKSVYLPLVADGEFRDVQIDVSTHPHWTGRITGLRIDPGGGARSGEFAIESIRGIE